MADFIWIHDEDAIRIKAASLKEAVTKARKTGQLRDEDAIYRISTMAQVFTLDQRDDLKPIVAERIKKNG